MLCSGLAEAHLAWSASVPFRPPRATRGSSFAHPPTADRHSRSPTGIMGKGAKGDILIFLQGELSIKDCVQMLAELDTREELAILPLYGRLSHEDQTRVFLDFPGKRKVIVATNIAETSVTIDGVVHVIDSGLAKMNFYSPKTFTESLVETPVSKASCNQRRGRAGRTAPESAIVSMRTRTTTPDPCIPWKRSNARTSPKWSSAWRSSGSGTSSPSISSLLPGRRGSGQPSTPSACWMPWMKSARSLETGRLMCHFPILPKHARMIVEAIRAYPSVIAEVIIAATFLSVNSPFLLPAGEELEARRAHHTFRDPLGDFVSYQRIYEAFTRAANKARFCENHYLDLRTMNEIINIDGSSRRSSARSASPSGPGRTLGRLPVRHLARAHPVRLRKDGERDLSQPDRGQDPDPPRIPHVPREPALHRRRGDRAHQPHVRALRLSASKAASFGHLSPAHAGLREGRSDCARTGEGEGRDFTNQMKIGQEVFPIRVIKGGRKMVIMEWEKLRARAPAARPGKPSFVQEHVRRDHVGRAGDLLRNEALRHPLPGSLPAYGRGRVGRLAVGGSFLFARDGRKLCSYLPRLLCLCPLKGHVEAARVSSPCTRTGRETTGSSPRKASSPRARKRWQAWKLLLTSRRSSCIPKTRRRRPDYTTSSLRCWKIKRSEPPFSGCPRCCARQLPEALRGSATGSTTAFSCRSGAMTGELPPVTTTSAEPPNSARMRRISPSTRLT